MVSTRSELKSLSKEELIDELLSVKDISYIHSKLSNLTSRFDDFLRWHEILNSELIDIKNCNRLLSERIVGLEKNAVSNAQYHRRESLEINYSVPASIGDVPENSVCKALSLTGYEVKPDDLQACHRLKKNDTAIVKFKCTKQKRSILINKTNLRNKSDVLTKLNFSGRLFISESMYHENHQLSYKCRQLKNAGKIHSTCFGITPSMLSLMKEVNQQRFITLLILKNFLELTI